MVAGVCLSVRLSVACFDLTREWKGPRKPKIGRMEVNHTGNHAVNLFRGHKVKGQGH